jgi:hypothetical protein
MSLRSIMDDGFNVGNSEARTVILTGPRRLDALVACDAALEPGEAELA